MKELQVDELKKVGVIAQKQKDYFLIRLKTVGGGLTSDELNAIALVSWKYGAGRVHLTVRQGVEIHNIHRDKLQETLEELEKNGIPLGACGPRGRGIVACPGNATCTSGIIETKELARELDIRCFRKEAPHKFKIAVSGCPNNCSKPVENDVGVMGGVLPGWDKDKCINCQLCINVCPAQAIRNNEEEYLLDIEKCILCGICINNCPVSAWKAEKTGYILYLGGTMGRKPRMGTPARTLIGSKDELIRYIERAFEFYLENGRKKERFGHTLDRIGAEKAFKAIFEEDKKIIDLRGVCCPMNFVQAKIAIDEIEQGQAIEFFLDEGEPLVNVTRSLKDEGHRVLSVIPEETYFKVLVIKN